MSTRCQLRFTDQGTDRVAQVYRHSDGYPESVLSNLDHLRRLVQMAGAQRDATYAAAQFIFVDKLWSLERSFRGDHGFYEDFPDSVGEVLEVESWEDRSKTPLYLLGHGVEDPSEGIHGDEEYLYVVKIPNSRSADWRVKIADCTDFPRWEDDGVARAFEVADWGFEGTLDEALAKLDRDP